MADWVGVVEAGYELGGDVDGWLRGVLAAAAPLLGGVGTVGWVYTLSSSDVRIDRFEAQSESPQLGGLVRRVIDGFPPEGLHRAHASPPEGSTLSSKILREHPALTTLIRERTGGAVQDAVAILAPTASGRGAVVLAPLREPRRATDREVSLFARVAAHLGAGLRLRLALEEHAADSEVGTEAVLDAGAKLLHATGSARGSRARDVLRQAVQLRERARTRRERAEPDSALALWEGLVAGRWSLVDRFEQDGRRFVVAHRNEPELGDPRGLTPRERQIAEYLGLGRSEKEIAYALGISPAAVSTAVRRAATKLGLNGRAELAAFFSPLGVRARLVELELAGEPLAAASVPLLAADAMRVLSEAEREVALDLLRGATVEEISSRRGRSAATVATQVKAIYEKLGVGSRVELAARVSGA